MDSRNIPREIFHISLGATSCVPQEDGPSGYVEYFTRDVSLVHYRAILHSAAPRVILPINNCKLSLDATRLVTIYSCLSMVMVFYFEVVGQYSIDNLSLINCDIYDEQVQHPVQ